MQYRTLVSLALACTILTSGFAMAAPGNTDACVSNNIATTGKEGPSSPTVPRVSRIPSRPRRFDPSDETSRLAHIFSFPKRL
ncbi:hypothetical protein FB451DRAFT_1398642 [Mycena latifolia]|nr:hypothetical protein FB451DRAFT_1398642 [Mycena latifolia]